MATYDGQADFLTPDGDHLVVSVQAGQRGGRWSGSIALRDSERRLERGDVCQLSADQIGEMRVIITDLRGAKRYDFVAMIDPDPHERLEPPV